MIRIKAPNEHFNGVRLVNVEFRDGVAEVESLSADAQARFEGWGFEVEDDEPQDDSPFSGEVEKARAFIQSASVKDILAELDEVADEERDAFVDFILKVEQDRDEPRSTLLKALEPQPNPEEE